VVLGLPFILTNASGYFGKAFEFDRQFFFKWSVNWNFLGEEVALSKDFAKLLLVIHLALLVVFLVFKWAPSKRRFFQDLRLMDWSSTHPLRQDYVVITMFTCNLIGIMCSRSLHYQFYSWYFFTLPIMLHLAGFHWILRVAIVVSIEVCWNIFPPHP
jgi:alpha-1,3-mannosyltransferase